MTGQPTGSREFVDGARRAVYPALRTVSGCPSRRRFTDLAGRRKAASGLVELCKASTEACLSPFFTGCLPRQPRGHLAELENAYMNVRRPATGTAATSGRRL